MTYEAAEQYLLSLANMPRREYMDDKRKNEQYLKRLHFFLDLLDNPEKKIPHYIHVAGTSGKGSVCSFLASILAESGKKTGCMISPHPTILRERWQVNGRMMSEKKFISIIDRMKPIIDRYERTSPYDMLSFFDLATAIGFLYFAQQRVSWAVVEVGCGGRYDSTNVIPKKDVAVITTIGLDHTEILGNTKEKIAYEKAGIVRGKCRVFTMERNEKILRVIRKECTKTASLLRSIPRTARVLAMDEDGMRVLYQGTSYHLNAIGAHQAHNASLCIDIARLLRIPDGAIARGLEKAPQPLRMEVISRKPLIILDGAHNADKIKSTVHAMRHILSSPRSRIRRVRLVLGFSADKNIRAMLRRLASLQPASVACTRNTINPFRKVASPKDIKREMRTHLPNTDIHIFLHPGDAYTWSRERMKRGDALLVTGSIFLSGELRKTKRRVETR